MNRHGDMSVFVIKGFDRALAKSKSVLSIGIQ